MLFLIILLNHLSKGRDTVMIDPLCFFEHELTTFFANLHTIFEVLFHFMAKVSDFAKLTRIFAMLTLFTMFDGFLIFQRLIIFAIIPALVEWAPEFKSHKLIFDVSMNR